MLTGYWNNKRCMFCELEMENNEGEIKPAVLILLNGDSFFICNKNGIGKRKLHLKDNEWFNYTLITPDNETKLHYHAEIA